MSQETYMSTAPSGRGLLHTRAPRLWQDSCSWEGVWLFALFWCDDLPRSAAFFDQLRFRAWNLATSVIKFQKTPRVCQENHVKEPYCKPAQNGGGKDVALETVHDSLQLTYHRLLIFCMLAPVAARPQCSYVKIHLEYVKRDLQHVKRITWKVPTDHKSK